MQRREDYLSDFLNEPAHQQDHAEHRSLDILATYGQKLSLSMWIVKLLNQKKGSKHYPINHEQKWEQLHDTVKALL